MSKLVFQCSFPSNLILKQMVESIETKLNFGGLIVRSIVHEVKYNLDNNLGLKIVIYPVIKPIGLPK